MTFPFRYRLKWIRLKSDGSEILAAMWQWIKTSWKDRGQNLARWIGPVLLLAVLSGCGPFGISFEIDQGQVNVATPPAGAPTRTPYVLDFATPTVNLDAPSDIPELVWMPLAQGPTEDGKVITVRPQKVGFEDSPVDFSMYWDYSGATGKLAYASEFFHAARGSNTSVSDLWVYDYDTQMSAMWLPDNTARAIWSPLQPGHFSDQRLAAAIYNTEEGRYDLGLASGPGQVQWLATCASPHFSWSPDATEIAYVAVPLGEDGAGVPQECKGVFIVSVDDGEVRQLTDIPKLYSGWFGDKPLWAEDQGSLLFTGASAKSVFWSIKTDGSETFETSVADTIQEDYLPLPQYSLWSSDHRAVISQTEGMMDPFGVWVYSFSDDMRTIRDAYRINWGDYTHNIVLLGWWEPGESVLLRDISNTSALNPFGVAMVWSLSDQYAFELSFSRPMIDVPVYPSVVRTGVEQVDQVIENFLVRKFDWRRDMLRTLTIACTTDQANVGPPSCPPGTPNGTKMEVFPYREHGNTKYVTPNELDSFLEFPLGGLYAVYKIPEGGFEADWQPAGKYAVVFVDQEGKLGVELAVDETGKVVRIEFWPLSPVEYLYDSEFDYLLPPLSQ